MVDDARTRSWVVLGTQAATRRPARLNPRLHPFVGLALCVVVLGCTAGTPATTDTSTARPAETSSSAAAPPSAESNNPLPVDPDLAPVSLSFPTPMALLALQRCGLLDYSEYVGGIAEIPRARDAPKWVKLHGTEPVLRSDAPAVLISVRGEINLRGTVFVEPICFFVDGRADWVSSGTRRSPEGDIVRSALVPRDPPTMRLPPLAP
jgi:hypothetical protein